MGALLYQHGSAFMMGTTYDVAAAAQKLCDGNTDVVSRGARKLAWVLELVGMSVRPLYPPVPQAPLAVDGAATVVAPVAVPVPALPYRVFPAPWQDASAEPHAVEEAEGGAGDAAASASASAAGTGVARSPGAAASSSPAGGAVGERGTAKKSVEDAHVPALLRLVHGSQLGIDKLRVKFR